VLVSYSAPSLLGATGVNLVVTGDVLINSNSIVDVNGLGYGTGFGPGPGITLGGIGSGGGHGGYGGSGGSSTTNVPGGIAFDSTIQPADKGCAGGSGVGGSGGSGGGS